MAAFLQIFVIQDAPTLAFAGKNAKKRNATPLDVHVHFRKDAQRSVTGRSIAFVQRTNATLRRSPEHAHIRICIGKITTTSLYKTVA